MQRELMRPPGAKAKSCLVLGLLCLLPLAREARAMAPFELPEREGGPGVLVYPAQKPGARGLTVVLHGMCSEPVNACRHFAEQVTAERHLVCPRASQRCEAGGSTWPAVGFAEQIERAVTRASAALGDSVDDAHGRTLIGYSLGAFRALELAEQGERAYPRVMLIGAKIHPNHERLRDSGVERLLLSAGSWDMMHDHMQRESRRLARRGFGSRFLGLGPVGHFFTPSFQRYLPLALDWLEGDDS